MSNQPVKDVPLAMRQIGAAALRVRGPVAMTRFLRSEVVASLASVTAAASSAAKAMPPDFRVSITNAQGCASQKLGPKGHPESSVRF